MVICVQQEQIQLVDTVVRFLSRIKGRRTTPVPMPTVEDLGVEYMPIPTFGLGGIIAVSKELTKSN